MYDIEKVLYCRYVPIYSEQSDCTARIFSRSRPKKKEFPFGPLHAVGTIVDDEESGTLWCVSKRRPGI